MYGGDEMTEALLIWGYLALGSLIHKLSDIFILPVLFGLGMAVFIAPFWWDYKEDIVKFFIEGVGKKIVKIYGSIVLLLIILGALYPDQDDLKFIIGGALVWNGIEYASDIEGVDKLPENIVNSMNHFLESIVEESEKEETN
jgi:hypothetical protein